MGWRQKTDIHQEIKATLREMEAFGESKYAAKQAFRAEHPAGTHIRLDNKIYSYSTARVYNRECQKFAEYVKSNSPNGRYTTLAAAKGYAKQYIQAQKEAGLSAYTVKLQASALSKLYSCSSKEWGNTGVRERQNISRSRERTVISDKTGKEIKNQSSRSGHFSEIKNKDIVEFASGTGLRRSELETLRGNQLRFDDSGRPCLEITGKGGKTRMAPVFGSQTEAIVERCKTAGDDKVWDKVPSKMDVHYYRGLYASNMYTSLARDESNIPPNDRYICRRDLQGTVYDKQAMQAVTNALGHNRISVIAGHYLYNIK